MPKKGIRKIIVDGVEYKYIVKPYGSQSWRICNYRPGIVTIEFPDGTYYKDTEPKSEITPSYVEALIRRERK